MAVHSPSYRPLQPNDGDGCVYTFSPRAQDTLLRLLVPCPVNSMTWPSAGVPFTAAFCSVSGAPAMLSPPRHPAVTSHTAACRRIVRCRQRQCHCQRYAQRAPTLLLTFTLSPSVPPSPGALAVDCSRTRPRSESKPCRKTPNPPANQSRLAAHSNQTSFPRYPLLEIWTPPTTSSSSSMPRETDSERQLSE